jgi:hypothetical protein
MQCNLARSFFLCSNTLCAEAVHALSYSQASSRCHQGAGTGAIANHTLHPDNSFNYCSILQPVAVQA